ncbi:hypothetical protein F7734_04535 [Scytonema sp. UIC 10036]|uniref:terpene synthase family protein n=1 Tax=Scytonema sp. UIC 10036 TaxID=2304196 RepID=UPI0012DA498C|nr:terpene synthase family protein [Scytonema sp. UIC 10036]MUG91783.1 hypothetical protein [Scytonema sp. UIC 10036]
MSVTSTVFDWRNLVANNKPSQASDIQIARLEALPQLTIDLDKWANQYNLPNQRVEVFAYTGCVTTLVPFSYQKALLFAKYCLWIVSFDAYIDNFDYSQFNPTRSNTWLDYLDSQLSYIVKPLYKLGGLTTEHGHNYCFKFSFDQLNEFQGIENTSLNLEAALQSLYCDLRASWLSAPQQEPNNIQRLNFSLTNFTHYLAQMIEAMRWELIQNFNYQKILDCHQLPNMEEYLNRSSFSIGLHPAGAIVAGYEIDPETTWQLCNTAIDIGAEIVRLANDLGNYWLELEECKVNSITIALAQLGFAPMGAYQKNSLEVKQAAEIVKAKLEVELERFAKQVIEIPNTPLLHWLQVQLAFVLAMYEKGNYVKPD